MHHTHVPTARRVGLKSFMRNNFFFGKLMAEYHFELETSYQNDKRALINRLVLGSGVVCGLDVYLDNKRRQIQITPGLGIDWWGREIVVPRKTDPIPIPDDKILEAIEWARAHHEDETCLQVMICYHECLIDPQPVMAGDCGSTQQCTPGTIREQYRVEFVPGCCEQRERDCRIENVIEDGNINLEQLAYWVTHRRCHIEDDDPCLCLANINFEFDENGKVSWNEAEVDISVRPICYTADMVFEVILALAEAREQASSETE